MINFDWGGGHPIKGVKADGFSCRWTGAIIPPKRGDYEFLLKADDSGSLTIDGKEVIVDSNYRETKTGKIYLDPSKRHNILIPDAGKGILLTCNEQQYVSCFFTQKL